MVNWLELHLELRLVHVLVIRMVHASVAVRVRCLVHAKVHQMVHAWEVEMERHLGYCLEQHSVFLSVVEKA